MTRISAVLILAFLLVADSPCTGSEDVRVLRGKHVVVLYDPAAQRAAEALADLYPEVMARLRGIFGWGLDVPPTVRLVADRGRFQRLTGSPLVVAFAVPAKNSIVIDQTRMNVRPFTLEMTLRHELCHLMLHRHIADPLLPAWLDEGVCQWVSDGVGEIMWDPKEDVLTRAARRGGLIPLGRLAGGFPVQRDALILAYAQSKGFVDFLLSEFGRQEVMAVLEALRGGQALDAAFQEAFGLGPDALETRWHEEVVRGAAWMVRISRHLYEILFGAGALLTLYAFIRILRKKRAYMEQMEEEDRTLH